MTSVVSQTDKEGVSRTVASIEGLILAREAAFKQYQIDISEFRERRYGTEREGDTDLADKFGDVFLVVDNFSDLYDKDSAMGDRLVSIARQGLSYAVHVATSATAWLVGQKQALVNVSNARIQLRLSNPDETQMGEGLERRKAARNTLDRPGFGVTREGHELLVGVPEIISASGERVPTRQLGAVIAEMTGVGRLEKLARLPEQVQLAQIIAAFAETEVASDPFNVPFAIGESALQPTYLPTRTVPSMLVLGRHLCGKTTTLAAFGQAVMSRFGPEQAQITTIDPKTSLIGKIRGPHVRAYAYTADDIDTVLEELAAIMRDRLPTLGAQPGGVAEPAHLGGSAPFRVDRRRAGTASARCDRQGRRERSAVGVDQAQSRDRPARDRVAVTRKLGRGSVTNPFLQKMTSSRAPTLFMDNDPATVKVFARVSAQQLPPGRGLLVTTDGAIEGVLVGTPE